MVERDVVGEGPREHPRHLADVGDLARAQEELRVVDLDVVPADAAFVVDESGEARQQARLARSHPTGQQHERAGVDVEGDAVGADGAVVVDGGHALPG